MNYMYDNIQYPDLYYRLYPKVKDCIDRNLNNMPPGAMPSEEQIEEMVDETYKKMIEECPEIANDPGERRRGFRNARGQQRPFYGRGRLLRDIISIIFLNELLRRFSGYPYGYYGPGYGFPPSYY